MVDYIFGKYLVESGKLTKGQLTETLQKQDTVRVKLGLIAVSEGMMTQEQADEVNRLQAVMDKRFGDIAVQKGYLTEEQVSKLLRQQGSTYLMFVQCLIDEQLVTMEEMDWLLQDFKRENGYSNTEMEALKSDEVERIVPLMMPEEAWEYCDLVSIVVRTMIRLIDRHIYIGQGAMVEELPADNQVHQQLVGEGSIVDSLAERDGALLLTSCVFGREDFARLDADALDAAGELLNCVNGLYASACSQKQQLLELMPPEYGVNVAGIQKACRIPIFVGDRGFYFTVALLS